MKRKLLTFSFISTFSVAIAQVNPIPFHWAKSTGSSGYDNANKNIADSYGNTYVTGSFEGTVDFNPGSGVTNLTSTGAKDAYIQKFSPNGDLLWARSIGGALIQAGTAVNIDFNGNVYWVGSFEGTSDLNPNAGINNATSQGKNDIFIVKLDQNGFFYWGKSFGGTEIETARAVKVDNSGGVNIVGGFKGTVDFDPGSNVFNITSTKNNGVFTYDGYVLKINSNGALTWVKAIQGIGDISISGVEAWNSSDIVCSGNFTETADFDPNAGVLNLSSAGSYDACMFKMSGTGTIIWAKRFGNTSYDDAPDLAIDLEQNVYLIGTYSAYAGGPSGVASSYSLSIDLDPNSGVVNNPGTASSNLYIVSLDKNGFYRWDYTLAPTSPNYPKSIYGFSIDVEICGNVYFTGALVGSVDADPGVGVNNLSNLSSSNTSLILGKLNTSGMYIGAVNVGGNGAKIFTTFVSTDYYGNAYVSGSYNKTVDFDPGNSTFNLSPVNVSGTSTPSNDAFHAKYGVHTWNNNANGASPVVGPVSPNGGGSSTSKWSDLPTNLNQAQVFPNPASNSFSIQLDQLASLEIFSISGQLIKKGIINEGINSYSVENLPAGAYILKISTDQTIQTETLYIQR